MLSTQITLEQKNTNMMNAAKKAFKAVFDEKFYDIEKTRVIIRIDPLSCFKLNLKDNESFFAFLNFDNGTFQLIIFTHANKIALCSDTHKKISNLIKELKMKKEFQLFLKFK